MSGGLDEACKLELRWRWPDGSATTLVAGSADRNDIKGPPIVAMVVLKGDAVAIDAGVFARLEIWEQPALDGRLNGRVTAALPVFFSVLWTKIVALTVPSGRGSSLRGFALSFTLDPQAGQAIPRAIALAAYRSGAASFFNQGVGTWLAIKASQEPGEGRVLFAATAAAGLEFVFGWHLSGTPLGLRLFLKPVQDLQNWQIQLVGKNRGDIAINEARAALEARDGALIYPNEGGQLDLRKAEGGTCILEVCAHGQG